MDRLYTPWRLAYVTRASVETPPCIFCAALDRLEDDPLVVHRGERAAFLVLAFLAIPFGRRASRVGGR